MAVVLAKAEGSEPVASGEKREFLMTDEDFYNIKRLAKTHTGIELSDHKREMIYSRLARRLRLLRLPSFSDYCDVLKNDESELPNFVNSITTNLTSFFRENHHFEYLAKNIIPTIKKKRMGNRRVRIWSSGCSTGEEPYSIAMIVDTHFDSSWDVKILATDLDSNVVSHGKRGLYTSERIKGVSEDRMRRYFDAVPDGYQAKEVLRKYITFKQLNLLHGWPVKGPFDLIFCRNVIIYFSKETQVALFNRYADLLQPDGHIFIGHSETLHRVSDRFSNLGNTMYQRCK